MNRLRNVLGNIKLPLFLALIGFLFIGFVIGVVYERDRVPHKSVFADYPCPYNRYRYAKHQEEKLVCYQDEIVKQADFDTFTPLYAPDIPDLSYEPDSLRYAFDKEFFYFDGKAIGSVQLGNYESYGDHARGHYFVRYIRHNDTIYGITQKSLGYQYLETLENVDRDTFEYLGWGYAKDKNNIYFSLGSAEAMQGVDPLTAHLVKVSWNDPRNTGAAHGFLVDKGRVYHNGKLLEGVDPNNMKIFNNGSVLQSGDTYYFYSGCHFPMFMPGSAEEAKDFYNC
jgi:hypothetical protein